MTSGHTLPPPKTAMSLKNIINPLAKRILNMRLKICIIIFSESSITPEKIYPIDTNISDILDSKNTPSDKIDKIIPPERNIKGKIVLKIILLNV